MTEQINWFCRDPNWYVTRGVGQGLTEVKRYGDGWLLTWYEDDKRMVRGAFSNADSAMDGWPPIKARLEKKK